MMHRISFVYLTIILIFSMPGCKNATTNQISTSNTDSTKIIGVSVWDRISARSEPLRNSSRVSLLSMGEKFIYLDTFAIDSSYNNTKFLKARLSDSAIVWVYDFASVLNAKPAVVTKEVPLYLRPDLLTISDEKLGTMEIVAVEEVWDEWIKVVSEKKEKRGWIKKEFITYQEIDLAFALLVKRDLEVEDPGLRLQTLQELYDNNPYPNTVFIPALKSEIDHQQQLIWEKEAENDREDQRNRNQWDRRDRNR